MTKSNKAENSVSDKTAMHHSLTPFVAYKKDGLKEAKLLTGPVIAGLCKRGSSH